jgi:hypothetical protein
MMQLEQDEGNKAQMYSYVGVNLGHSCLHGLMSPNALLCKCHAGSNSRRSYFQKFEKKWLVVKREAACLEP